LSYVLAVAQSDPSFVVFVDASARHVAITAAPIDVGTPINGTLLQLSSPIVFTSATLTIGGSSRHYQLRVGLEADVKAGEPSDTPAIVIDTQVFASPFRFDERAALYVPTGAPENNDATSNAWYFDELEFLAELSGGGMMALFTSRRAMDEAYERMNTILTAKGIPCARQGDRPRGALLDELRQHPTGAALFATHSFWEGVDVAGRALRMVVIDRLPFRVPTDPLVRARADMAKARGLDPFRDIAVPEAALALKQGVGRLLRTVNDAGVVAVLDGRLRQKAYGKVFLDALPPMMRVGSRRVLSQFWARRVAPVLGLPAPMSAPPEAGNE
jgi:ATP-dependent DNA helicase DinG